MKVTATAPPITSARLGSQLPVTSRKPTTFCGLTICEMARPSPKMIPDAIAVRPRNPACESTGRFAVAWLVEFMSDRSGDVASDIDRDSGGTHEGQYRHQRAQR